MTLATSTGVEHAVEAPAGGLGEVHQVGVLVHDEPFVPAAVPADHRRGARRRDPQLGAGTAGEGQGHAIAVRDRITKDDRDFSVECHAHLLLDPGAHGLEAGGGLQRPVLGRERVVHAEVLGLDRAPGLGGLCGRGQQGEHTFLRVNPSSALLSAASRSWTATVSRPPARR